MDEAELFLWRKERLQAAIKVLTEGNMNAFGRQMGYSDGTFVRQMLSGKREITEKTVRQVERLPGLDGWFDADSAEDLDSVEFQIRSELLRREVPEHTLRTILDLVRAAPVKRRAA